MTPQIYWILPFTSFRLGTMARPRGGDWLEDEIKGWKRAGVDVVVSALTDSEMTELDIASEPSLCADHGIKFFRFPTPDRGTPSSSSEWLAAMGSLSATLTVGSCCVAPCRMGIGRASMIAVSMMLHHGVGFEDAFQWVAEARGLSVPDTEQQRAWILDYSRMVSTAQQAQPVTTQKP